MNCTRRRGERPRNSIERREPPALTLGEAHCSRAVAVLEQQCRSMRGKRWAALGTLIVLIQGFACAGPFDDGLGRPESQAARTATTPARGPLSNPSGVAAREHGPTLNAALLSPKFVKIWQLVRQNVAAPESELFSLRSSRDRKVDPAARSARKGVFHRPVRPRRLRGAIGPSRAPGGAGAGATRDPSRHRRGPAASRVAQRGASTD